MPPAVAQAPMVTRPRERRAHLLDALGVVGRGDRALDQREVVGTLDAPRGSPRGSRRSRPRRRAASSSSSQSSSVSWQPSQEANFQTASFGRSAWSVRPSQLPHRRSAAAAGRAENTGPSRQTKCSRSWQWPHSPMPHRMLRSIDTRTRSAGHAAVHQRGRAKRIITSGPHDQRQRALRVEASPRDQLGHHADVAVPAAGRPVDGHRHLEPGRRPALAARRRRADPRACGRRRAR